MDKRIYLLILIGLLAFGCGHNPDDPVYDISKNPDGFPAFALAVLDSMQTEKVKGLEQVGSSFANLYTQHTELLDSKEWKRVVERLGSKFRYFGDRYAMEGLPGYVKAAECYQLAALARPQDERARTLKETFQGWWNIARDSAFASTFCVPAASPPLLARVELLKSFLLSDSLRQNFGRTYLLDQLLPSAESAELLTAARLSELPMADRAFLASLGRGKDPMTQYAVSFTHPAIDLITCAIEPLDAGYWRAELYFIPHNKLDSNYVVSLMVLSADSATVLASGGHLTSYDFRPDPPTTTWRTDRVAVAFQVIPFASRPAAVRVGLYDVGPTGPHYLTILGHTEKTFTLALPETRLAQ